MCLINEHKPRFYERKIEYAYKIFRKTDLGDGKYNLNAMSRYYSYNDSNRDADGWFNTDISCYDEGFYAFINVNDALSYIHRNFGYRPNFVVFKVAVKDVVSKGEYCNRKAIRYKAIKILEEIKRED